MLNLSIKTINYNSKEMAKIIENEKSFKVIEVNRDEVINWGGLGICDHCGTPSEMGFYVAVLNSWLCQRCYEEWCGYAVYYEEDKGIEERNFKTYKALLGLEWED